MSLVATIASGNLIGGDLLQDGMSLELGVEAGNWVSGGGSVL